MPKKTAPLTATQVKNTKATDKELYLFDGGGLVLLVKPSGVNIPMSKSVRFHEYQTGKQHADALKDAYQNH